MKRFIDLSDLPEHLQHRPARLQGDEDRQPLSLDEVRKVHIQKVLQMCNGNRLRAAQILGIGRTSLYRYLRRDGFGGTPGVHFFRRRRLTKKVAGRDIISEPFHPDRPKQACVTRER